MLGYNGKYLLIDLNTGDTASHDIPSNLFKGFVGGRGMGARLLYELLPAHIEPLSPQNLLIIGTGPLTGTMTPGSSKHIITTLSPETGGFLDSYSSGRVGPELRAAGYDFIVVRGKAKVPSILVMNDSQIEICDALDLWGKDAYEAETILHERYGSQFSYMVIGPAGERLVRYASVNSEFYRQAARGGVGAVFGSKNLKAIMVRGSGKVPCQDPLKLMEITKTMIELSRTNEINISRMHQGTPGTMCITSEAGMLPTRNFTRVTYPEGAGKIDGVGVGRDSIGTRGCFGCFTPCSKVGKFTVDEPCKDNTLEGPEYETASLLGSNLDISSLPFVLKANYECDRLGLDTISAGVVIGFIMECFERGLLNAKDLDGLEPKFGDENVTLEMLKRIAYREGFGFLMGEGVKRMAESIGKGTERFAIHCKGMEFPGYDPRGAYGCALTFAVNPRGACHRRAWPPLELFSGANPHTVEGKAKLIKGTYDEQIIMHLLMVCDFPASAIPMSIDDYLKYLNVTLGTQLTTDDLFEAAERTETLIRMFNNREGKGRADDQLPDRIICEAPPDGPAKGLVIGKEAFNRMLSEYYELRGWDDEGVPTKQTLEKLGLVAGMYL